MREYLLSEFERQRYTSADRTRRHTGHSIMELKEKANHRFVFEALAMAVLFSTTLG
jgi:hypothetical protein